MRQALRILARLWALLSLTLFLAFLLLGLRSYFANDVCGRSWYDAQTQELRHCSFASIRGRAQMSLSWLRFDAGKIINSPEAPTQGDIYIPPTGVLRYSKEWVSELPVSRPKIEHWWEGTGLFVRWGSNDRNGFFPATQSYLLLVLPYWMLCGLFSIWPVVWGMRYWKTRRWRPGTCRNCGYDLRASPETCPECGMIRIGAGEAG